ncbi:MAG: helix-turn-helix domain-containing protein [Bacteroidales bacterium]|nr:helix-turn-helix domain-containing protein [Bacteroidales bacterium]MCM1148091.1 helix-turn-helix domain-containing protein [Bacteroidales bacterium]MCM1509453.1 helix-turn-helix domain-containing protein [Clostridium sp.]
MEKTKERPPVQPEGTKKSTEEQLRELKAQLDRIEAYSAQQLIQTKEVLTVKEAALFIGLSESRIHTLCSRKEIPYYKREGDSMNNRTCFKRKELVQWMTARSIATKDERASAALLHMNRISKKFKNVK